ncbi:MAG: RNA polymerase factor sigma-54 [bacterium]|jgi:RNA polymerase sigma-54 factor
MLKQSLQQKLLQKLSPQQIQFIKLLQIPTVMLDSRIKEELEENPALEDGSLSSAEEIPEYQLDDDDDDKINTEERTEQEEFNIDDYIQDDDQDDGYKMMSDNDSDDEDKKEMPIAVSTSFHDTLLAQLSLNVMADHEFMVAQQILGSLDDDGYLRRPINALVDDLAFSQNINTTEAEVEHLLEVIQNFDPAGVGARSLQECLLLQLKRKDTSQKSVKVAIEIVSDYLDEFTKKHYDKLEKSLNINSEELKEAIQEILRLNPKPGNSYADNNKQLQVIPDFIITKNDNYLLLTLNSKNAPELRVSRSYQEMFQTYDKASQKDKKMKEAVQFVKQKLDSAKWFIDAIKQRQQTLIKTMNAIMNFQYDYFLTGDDRKLRPMILKDIADQVQMDISTVSRVANSKYVQTEFGTFLLKSFFSEGIQTDSGEEVSNREVKKILEECISGEDKHKPLADERLAEILKERGYNIARRTVAKYREQLNIPVARLRKEL